jgi:DNA-binding MarR family transcriptional regulator
MLVSEPQEKVEFRSQAEELAQIAMELQRRLFARLSQEISTGSVSFPQFFLLTYLDRLAPITMSDIAARMGHTTAAATGLVDRLERIGFVARAHAVDDRRKVIVRITPKGSNLVSRVRQDIVDAIATLLRDQLTPEQGKTWVEVYRKVSSFCEKKISHE